MTYFRWLPSRVICLALARLVGAILVCALAWLAADWLVRFAGPDLNATVGAWP